MYCAVSLVMHEPVTAAVIAEIFPISYKNTVLRTAFVTALLLFDLLTHRTSHVTRLLIFVRSTHAPHVRSPTRQSSLCRVSILVGRMVMIYPLSFILNLFKSKNSKGISLAYVDFLRCPCTCWICCECAAHNAPPPERALVLPLFTQTTAWYQSCVCW
jgi:hypothetical protein